MKLWTLLPLAAVAGVAFAYLTEWMDYTPKRASPIPHMVRWANAASNTLYVPQGGLPTNGSGQLVFGMRDDGIVVWKLP